jgi:hypothetical protein
MADQNGFIDLIRATSRASAASGHDDVKSRGDNWRYRRGLAKRLDGPYRLPMRNVSANVEHNHREPRAIHPSAGLGGVHSGATTRQPKATAVSGGPIDTPCAV